MSKKQKLSDPTIKTIEEIMKKQTIPTINPSQERRKVYESWGKKPKR